MDRGCVNIHLTPTERQIIEALLAGHLTSKDIADVVMLSPLTVRNYISVMGEKIGYRRLVGIMYWALRNGFEMPCPAPTATKPDLRFDYEF